MPFLSFAGMKLSKPMLISDEGSTRATAYQLTNHSVTLGNKTHLVWLDTISKIRGRTYDHETGELSPVYDIFEGKDNHACPCLMADENQYLHLVGGPHSWWGSETFDNQGRFKYFRSVHPNRMDQWEDGADRLGGKDFGYGATYASMIRMPNGHNATVYRGGEMPRSTLFQRQRPLGGWTCAREILHMDIEPQYTNYGAQLVCDADGTLYVAAHFYRPGFRNGQPGKMKKRGEKLPASSRSLGVGIIKVHRSRRDLDEPPR